MSNCNSIFQSTDCMCGEFTDPEAPLPGACASYRLKKDCEAPVIPTLAEVTYDPDANPPFTVS